MIEPIRPDDSDVSALLQLAQQPGRIREVHLFPIPTVKPHRHSLAVPKPAQPSVSRIDPQRYPPEPGSPA